MINSHHEWSETGDRYMLKLFRDFVFHQTDQLGAPYLDLAHIVSVLNKVSVIIFGSCILFMIFNLCCLLLIF